MAQVYTPGLQVTRRARLRRRRVLPIHGQVLVRLGDRVAARDAIAQTLLPGPITPVNVANLLSIPPGDLPAAMLKRQGETVAAGEILARSKGIFGWLRKECASPAAGLVETVSSVTGQVMLRAAALPVELQAFLAGTIVEVVEAEGAVVEAEGSFIQGIFGIGGEAFGPICMACRRPDQNLTAETIVAGQMRGAVVIGGGRVTSEALQAAVAAGVAAIVTGGIDDEDLRDFLGYDLGVATTGSEHAGLTLIITEGFGEIAMAGRTFELLASRAGCDAAVTGATQIRAGVQRPEVLIPWDGQAAAVEAAPPRGAPESGHVLRPGIPVRIIRDPYFGIIGTAVSLPEKPQVLGSGSKARVLEVELPTGEKVFVPRANVELIEE